MLITLFSATGMGGKAALRKALARGDDVTLLLRRAVAISN